MNRHEAISNFQPALAEALSTHGWAIKKRQKYINHFWFLEAWILQSQWSPTDLQLFLMFEHDEMFYSAAIAFEEPFDHHSADWKARLYLKRGWEQELGNFIAALKAIRDKAATSPR